MATPTHTPKGRGYNSSLNYFGHGNWGWSELEWGGSSAYNPLVVRCHCCLACVHIRALISCCCIAVAAAALEMRSRFSD